LSGAKFLFGFAPGGACPALLVTMEAVRSYRTFSPLPKMAVCFLRRFPSNDVAITWPSVTRHRFRMEPGLSSKASPCDHPADWRLLSASFKEKGQDKHLVFTLY